MSQSLYKAHILKRVNESSIWIIHHFLHSQRGDCDTDHVGGCDLQTSVHRRRQYSVLTATASLLYPHHQHSPPRRCYSAGNSSDTIVERTVYGLLLAGN